MKNPNDAFQLLLQQTSAMYDSEKEISGIFEALNVDVNTRDAYLKEGIIREAQENKNHCMRLEGLLNVLYRNPHKNCQDESSWDAFIGQFSSTMKRVIVKHADFGYSAAIIAAMALGQNEIASSLRCSVSNGNTVK